MFSDALSRILKAVRRIRNPAIEHLLTSSLAFQLATLVTSIARVPISLNYFSFSEYGSLILMQAYWQLVMIFGESARKSWRIDSETVGQMPLFTYNKRALAWYVATTASASLFFLLTLGWAIFFQACIVLTMGILFLRYSPYTGVLEANGFYGKVNWLQTASTISFFVPWVASCLVANAYLYVLTICGSSVFFAYSCKTLATRKITRINAKVSQEQHVNSNYVKFLQMILVSKSSYLLDPFMIQAQIGSAQVVIHAVYQKFLNLYSLTPSAFTSLYMVESRKSKNSKTSRQAGIYVNIFTILLTIVLIFSASKIISLLSSDQIIPSYYLISIVLAQGFIGSVVSRRIESSTSRTDLTKRLKLGAGSTILGASVTFAMLPVIGISAAFITSIINSLILYFFLRPKRSSN